MCRGWRRAGQLRKLAKRKAAFALERRPVLADIAKFAEPADKALALRNLAAVHAKWELHEDAVELLTMALGHTPEDRYLTYQRAKEHREMDRCDCMPH